MEHGITKKQNIAQMGNPVLRRKSKEVMDVADPKVKMLITGLMAALKDAAGVGIAAPQLSQSMRVIIVASHPNKRYPNAPLMEPTPMINPVISRLSEETEKDWEGCLSVPGIRGLVPRAASLTVQYLTETGQQEIRSFNGFIARIVQHETDHLDGILFPDRMETMKDLVTDKEYFRIIGKKS